MGATFLAVLLAWVFFRADNISVACSWLARMFTLQGGFNFFGMGIKGVLTGCFPAIAILVCMEWFNRTKQYGFARYPRSVILRWVLYLILALVVIFFRGTQQEFIYFQF